MSRDKYFTPRGPAEGRVGAKGGRVAKTRRGRDFSTTSAFKFQVPRRGGGLNWLYNKQDNVPRTECQLGVPFAYTLVLYRGTMHRQPPHISYTLLHFLNMTRRVLKSLSSLKEGASSLLAPSFRIPQRWAGRPFYMQNFTGRGSETAIRIKRMNFIAENNARNFRSWTIILIPFRFLPRKWTFLHSKRSLYYAVRGKIFFNGTLWETFRTYVSKTYMKKKKYIYIYVTNFRDKNTYKDSIILKC